MRASGAEFIRRVVEAGTLPRVGITISEFKDIAAAAQDLTVLVSVLVGGGWAAYRFILQRERYPHINFSSDIHVIGRQGEWLLVELIAIVENKGRAPHRMSDFGFDLNAMLEGDPVVTEERWGGQVNFPHRIKSGSYLPQHMKFFFVDPGTTAKYSYITKVPLHTNYLMLHSNFIYLDRGSMMHTSEKTIRIPDFGEHEERLSEHPEPSCPAEDERTGAHDSEAPDLD